MTGTASLPPLALIHGRSVNGQPVELIGEPRYFWPIIRYDGLLPVFIRYSMPDGQEFDASPDWLLAVNGEAVRLLDRARAMERTGR